MNEMYQAVIAQAIVVGTVLVFGLFMGIIDDKIQKPNTARTIFIYFRLGVTFYNVRQKFQ